MISFVQYSGTSEASVGPTGERFIDNKQFAGRIPDTVDAAECDADTLMTRRHNVAQHA